jgi:hypothetical protein
VESAPRETAASRLNVNVRKFLSSRRGGKTGKRKKKSKEPYESGRGDGIRGRRAQNSEARTCERAKWCEEARSGSRSEQQQQAAGGIADGEMMMRNEDGGEETAATSHHFTPLANVPPTGA